LAKLPLMCIAWPWCTYLGHPFVLLLEVHVNCLSIFRWNCRKLLAKEAGPDIPLFNIVLGCTASIEVVSVLAACLPA
jgi:hypothetical protein